MKYYILIDTRQDVTYKSEVTEYTEKELDTAKGLYRNALHFDDNILIENSGNSYIVRTIHIVALSFIKA